MINTKKYKFIFSGNLFPQKSKTTKLVFEFIDRKDPIELLVESEFLIDSYRMASVTGQSLTPLEETTKFERLEYVSSVLASYANSVNKDVEREVFIPFGVMEMVYFILYGRAYNEAGFKELQVINHFDLGLIPSGFTIFATVLNKRWGELIFKQALFTMPAINDSEDIYRAAFPNTPVQPSTNFPNDTIDVMKPIFDRRVCLEAIWSGSPYQRNLNAFLLKAPGWESLPIAEDYVTHFVRCVPAYEEAVVVFVLYKDDRSKVFIIEDDVTIYQGTRVDYYHWMKCYELEESRELLQSCTNHLTEI